MRNALTCRLPALAVFLLAAAAVHGAPAAHWISPVDLDTDGKARLRQTWFNAPGTVKAILLAASHDEENAVASINGKVVGTIAKADTPTAIDITEHLRLGNNAIGIRAAGAVAVMIEITRDDGKTQWLVTDASWRRSARAAKGWDEPDFDAAAWKPATSHGQVGAAAGNIRANPFVPNKIVDAYNSWRLAARNEQATDPKTITALPGFTVELIRSAKLDEDSWIALAFDPKGRLTIAKERVGLLRMTLAGGTGNAPMTVSRVENLENTLLECRGLLYAHGDLYVNANNSRALYRLRDTTPNDNIDFFNDQKLLLRTEGGFGHGRNHLALGPDGAIYITHGNDVRLPASIARHSPYKRFDVDRLIASPWDGQLDSAGEQTPGGHVIRMDKEGVTFELFAAGFRNPMGVAFNADGEMFTYDADMELDLGAPWYRPTRINHVISGGEYGWRRSTAKWPEHFADSMGSVCDIGLGSPTAVRFGTNSKFPPRYQAAMFVGDWAYGRILAVHLSADGSTYTGGFETFLSGRPLNVTDFTFGPDGALYFITGGRQTQSGLYRVRYTGPAQPAAIEPTDAEVAARFNAEKARFLRMELEEAHKPLTGDEAKSAVNDALAQLGSTDRAMRFAARVALEHQDPALWQEQVLAQKQPVAAITGMIALTRAGELRMQSRILSKLGELPLRELPADVQLMALRAYSLAFIRMGRPDAATIAQVLPRLEAMYPSPHRLVNLDLCELLAFLDSRVLRERTFALIEATDAPADLLHYLCVIRTQRQDWNVASLSQFLRGVNKASHQHPGRYYTAGLRALRVEMAGAMSPALKQQLADLLAEPAPPASHQAAKQAVFVRDWKMEDLLPALDRAAAGRSFEKGRDAFAMAQCGACHRIGSHVPGSETGPDLTAVASRFNRRDLLDSILNPSKAIDDKFKQTQITLTDGRVLSGYIIAEGADTITLHASQLSLDGEVIPKREIATRKLSDISPMPTGLLSVLTQEQILDLIAFLEAGGRSDHRGFQGR